MKVKKLEISDNISIKDMFETSVKSNSIWVVYYNTDIIFGTSNLYSYLIYFYNNKEMPYPTNPNVKTLKYEKMIFGEGSNLVDVYEKILSFHLGFFGGINYAGLIANSSSAQDFEKYVNSFSFYNIKKDFEENENNNENLIKNYLEPLKNDHYLGQNFKNSSANKRKLLKEFALLKSLNILEVKLN